MRMHKKPQDIDPAHISNGNQPAIEGFNDEFQLRRYTEGIGVVGDGDPAFNRERSLLMGRVRKRVGDLLMDGGEYRYARTGD